MLLIASSVSALQTGIVPFSFLVCTPVMRPYCYVSASFPKCIHEPSFTQFAIQLVQSNQTVLKGLKNDDLSFM